MRPRDSQRQKVFEAERLVSATTLTASQAATWARTIMTSRWWKKRHPREVSVLCSPRWRCASSILHVSTGNQLDVLHAMAHILVPTDVAWHGPEFVREYLTLVERFISKDAKANLTKIFRAAGVETSTWNAEAKQAARKRALDNPESTTFGAAKLERDKNSMLELLAELHAEVPPLMPEAEVKHRARKAVTELIRNFLALPEHRSWGDSTFHPSQKSLIGDEEPERIRAAMKKIADELGAK